MPPQGLSTPQESRGAKTVAHLLRRPKLLKIQRQQRWRQQNQKAEKKPLRAEIRGVGGRFSSQDLHLPLDCLSRSEVLRRKKPMGRPLQQPQLVPIAGW